MCSPADSLTMVAVSPSRTFPASARLKKRSEYRRVQSSGAKVYGRYCVVIGLPRSDCDKASATCDDLLVSRLGVTVTRKVHKRAVVRNLFKRRVREIFRCAHPVRMAGLDIVVIARPGAVQCEFAALQRDLKGALVRLLKKRGSCA